MARQLISFSSKIETEAFDPTVDVEELMQEAQGKLFEISQRNMKQDYTQIDPVISQAMEVLKKASANSDGLTGIPTGYNKLDDMTSGWQHSDLVILAGRPAMGKTAFALSLAKNIAIDQKIPVAFFSLEMSNVQLVNRLISNVCEVEGKKILNGQLSNDEWSRLDKNLRRMTGAPLYVDDTPGLSVFELRTKARRLVKEKKVQIIMIDYLQLMTSAGGKGGGESRQQVVSDMSRMLKIMAKELNVPVICLSQLSRANEKRDDKRPMLSDLRESGAIEQDADIVLFLYRDDYYNEDSEKRNIAECIVAKNRHGETGKVELRWMPEYTTFATLENRYDEDE